MALYGVYGIRPGRAGGAPSMTVSEAGQDPSNVAYCQRTRWHGEDSSDMRYPRRRQVLGEPGGRGGRGSIERQCLELIGHHEFPAGH